MKWYRMYYEARNDAKLKILTDSQHRVWFNLMCYAAENGGITPTGDHYLLAVEVANGDLSLFESTLELLSRLHITEETETGIEFLNFAKRQFDKPSNTPGRIAERVKKHRKKSTETPDNAPADSSNADVTPCNAPNEKCNASETRETPPDTDTESETEKDKKHYVPAAAATPTATPKKGRRIFGAEHMALAERLKKRILETKPDARVPNSLDQWADTIRLMIEHDKHAPQRVAEIIDFCQQHNFWRKNILGADKLRVHFDALELEFDAGKKKLPARPELSGETALNLIRDLVG